MAEELGERTELPTGRRRSEARGKGQIAKSVDLGAAIDLLGAVILLCVLGPAVVYGLAAVTRQLLDSTHGAPGTSATALSALVWALQRAAWIGGPVLGVMFLIAAFAQFIQVGRLFTWSPVKPKLSKLNPLSGAKRLFGRRNLIKSIVAVAKLSIVVTVAVMVINGQLRQIVALSMLHPLGAARLAADLILDMSLWVVSLLLLIGLIDYSYQRWQRTQDLKMTKQEIKDERKSMEGDMETRMKRLRMGRQQIMQRLRTAVPTADVIVTNPTHFAVALKYDADKMSAPRVVAKGADHLAFRIREIAAVNGIPLIEKPPLARALYANIEVGRAITPEYYEAVAEILAYVYRLQSKAA
ncbi:MAG: flagellar biosynthesis protein FlhB [Phycisphaerales bacterium]|nr:flagellar biosynthesis protein FlhB [Phycisphaerales bacterium]